MFKLKIAFWSFWGVFPSLQLRFRFVFFARFCFFLLFTQDSSHKIPMLSESAGFEGISGRISGCFDLFYAPNSSSGAEVDFFF